MNGILNPKNGRHRQRMLAPDWETHRLIQMSNAIKENRMFNFTTPSGESIHEVVLDITGRGKRRGVGIFVAPHLLVVNALAAELLKNTGFINDVYGQKKSYAPEIKLAVSQIICTGYLVYSKRHDLISKYPEGVFICKEVRLKSFTEKYVTTDLGRKEVAEVLLRSEEMVDFFLGSQKVVSVGIMGEEIPNRDVPVASNELLVVHEKLDEMNKGIISVHELFSKYNQIVLDNVSESTNLMKALKEGVSNVTPPLPEIKDLQAEVVKIQESVSMFVSDAIAKPKNDTPKFEHKLPAGTRWENFIFSLVDEHTFDVIIGDIKGRVTYENMGMFGKGKQKSPSAQWSLLKILAESNGEIALDNPKVDPSFKKQKQLLSDKLMKYFGIDYDPFYPYKSSLEKQNNSYKVKFTIVKADIQKPAGPHIRKELLNFE